VLIAANVAQCLDGRDVSFTYLRIHLLSHTSGNCDERATPALFAFVEAASGSREIPVTCPIRKEAVIAANFTGWTLPLKLLRPL